MDRLVGSLRRDLAQVFRSEDYQDQRQALEACFAKARTRLMNKLKQRAKGYGFRISPSRQGIFDTLLFKGHSVQLEPFEARHEQVDAETAAGLRDLNEAIRSFFQPRHALQEETNAQIKELNRRVAFDASEPRFDRVRQKSHLLPKVLKHLRAVQLDRLEHLEDIGAASEVTGEAPGMEGEPAWCPSTRYAVNAVVDHGQT